MSTIEDVLAFDDAVAEALIFAQRHPDETLVIVTGDHECGGMTVGFAGTGYNTFFTELEKQNISYVKFSEMFNEMKTMYPKATFEEAMPIITEYFGLTAKGDGSEMDLSPYELQQLKAAFAESMKDAKVRANDEATYLAYGGYEPLTVTITHILNQKAGIVLLFVPTGFEGARTINGVSAKAQIVEVDDSHRHVIGFTNTGEQTLVIRVLRGKLRGEVVTTYNHFLGKLDWVGLKAVVSFFFTALLIWKILLPRFLNYFEPLTFSLAVVGVLTGVIIFLVAGLNKKGLVAFLGAFSGVVLTCLLSITFGAAFKIPGEIRPFSETLLYSGFP